MPDRESPLRSRGIQGSGIVAQNAGSLKSPAAKASRIWSPIQRSRASGFRSKTGRRKTPKRKTPNPKSSSTLPCWRVGPGRLYRQAVQEVV